MSIEPHPIKVAAIAPIKITQADEIAIEISKTGKVNAVVAVVSIFSKNRCNLRSAKSGNEKPSCQKTESAHSPEGNPADQVTFLQKQEKASYQRN